MTRREELEVEIAHIEHCIAAWRLDLDPKRRELAALPPDPPVFRVSDAVSRKALEARWYDCPNLQFAEISDRDSREHAALIQAWVEEQFPYGKDLCSITAIRAKAGFT